MALYDLTLPLIKTVNQTIAAEKYLIHVLHITLTGYRKRGYYCHVYQRELSLILFLIPHLVQRHLPFSVSDVYTPY